MNRNRIMVVVGIALLLAVLASVGAYKFLSGQSRVAEQARLQTVGIVVAVVDIPLGSTINPNQVAVSPWPKEATPRTPSPIRRSLSGGSPCGTSPAVSRSSNRSWCL